MRFDASEPLGGPVLVAEQRIGRGKVLVFGDTSSFVNGIVVSTHEFVGRVLRWLATPGGNRIGRFTIPIAIILVLIAALVALRNAPLSRVSLLVLIVTLVIVPEAARWYWLRNADHDPEGNIAYVDASHLPRVSQEGWRDDGLMGLHMNLMRNGLLSFNLFDFDKKAVARSQLLVIVSPSKRFGRGEVRALRQFVTDGGTLIVSVGFEEVDASRRLLEAFELEVEDMPLGHFRVQSPVLGLEAMFYEAWPMRDRSGRAEIISAHGEYPLIVAKKVGMGRVVAIGDSQFLMNKNLEAEKSYYQVNIDFLKALLAHLGLVVSKGASPPVEAGG
jgi:hypothetical protein